MESGLDTQNLVTLDIHRRIFKRVKSKMADAFTDDSIGSDINDHFLFSDCFKSEYHY